jgi:hypothetical protein
MSIEIIARAPRIRCYACGSIEVEAVCHHCERAMCRAHKLAAVDAAGKPTSVEFMGLGLKEAPCGEVPIHCKDCNHRLRAPTLLPIVWGGVIALAAILLPTSTGTRLFGVLFGGVLAGGGWFIWRKRAQRLVHSRPPLPFLPRFNAISIRESVRGRIDLDSSGGYNASVLSAGGRLTIASNFGKPERDQLQQYRKRFRLLDDDDVQFHAGFAVLRGSAGIRYRDVSGEAGSLVVPLTGRVGEHPYFTGDSRVSGEWRRTREYHLLESTQCDPLPLRLVPSLIQEAAQRALDIEIQWPEVGSSEKGLTMHRIGLFDLRVPVAWGRVEHVTDSAVVGIAADAEGSGAVRTIAWRGLPVAANENRAHRRTFTVRFEEKIDLDDFIEGQLDVTLKGTLSQLKGIDLFYALGGKRESEETVEVTTRIVIDFRLSLAGLRYQEVRVVPDPKKDVDKQEIVTFDGVIPDYATVIALTNAMSEDFYVKRVIENPPRTGEKANVLNRYWDIAGRYYLGVYPIDYHLILSGEAVYGGGVRAQSGTTKVTLTVQGSYANADMEAQIENVWDRLCHLVQNTLGQLTRPKPSPGWNGAAPPPPFPDVPVDEGLDVRRSALRKRLDQMFDAFAAGRLTEEHFLKLKSEIEAELRGTHASASSRE